MSDVQIPPHQIELLHHTLGLNERNREPYRNHFVAGEGHHDQADLLALESAGLMTRRKLDKVWGGGDCFYATDAGKELAIAKLPQPRKRTRYEDYLDADGCDSFGEFLCGSRLPEFEEQRDYLGKNTQYRMFRRIYSRDYDRYGYRDVEGEWCSTMKEAKASYKAALKARLSRPRNQSRSGIAR